MKKIDKKLKYSYDERYIQASTEVKKEIRRFITNLKSKIARGTVRRNDIHRFLNYAETYGLEPLGAIVVIVEKDNNLFRKYKFEI